MQTPYQRSFVEISKSAFAHNVHQLRMVMGPSAFFAPVIKANAYGHGLLQIAAWCQESDAINWICVSLLSDALWLRADGIIKPILVIGAIDTDPVNALGKDIHLFLYSEQQAHELHTCALRHEAQFPVHIKIDTGLSRLGFLHTTAADTLKKLQLLNGLLIMGIYSHFAEAQAENPEFCQLQIERFRSVVDQLHNYGITAPFIHMANSAGALRFTIPECNFFRIGAALYGLWPSQQTKKEILEKFPHFSLKPVLSWKSHIMHIQHIETGSFVGYNRTYQVTRDSRIATIPVGYQDGYDIQFSNNGRVMIGKDTASIVGRICMNHLMIDVTDLPGTSVGDIVTLVGHETPVDVYTLAQLSGNNNVRELLTHISPSFERVIVE